MVLGIPGLKTGEDVKELVTLFSPKNINNSFSFDRFWTIAVTTNLGLRPPLSMGLSEFY